MTQHHNSYSSALAMTVKYESTGIEGRHTGSRDEESDSRKEKIVIQNAKKAAICPKTGRNEHNKTNICWNVDRENQSNCFTLRATGKASMYRSRNSF